MPSLNITKLDQAIKIHVFHMVKRANHCFLILALVSIPGVVFPQCSEVCDLTELTFRTEVLESNLDRIRHEIRANQKTEDRLFNELQLVRFNNRLGSIQRKEVSTISMREKKSELNIQSYPDDEKLNEIEEKVSNVQSKIHELKASAIRLEREILRIDQLNSPSRDVSSEALDDGIMINVVDSSGRVLRSEHCAGNQCLKAKTLSVDIPESGTYYLQLLSGSSTKTWGDGYRIKIIPSDFVDSARSTKSAVPLDKGELVSGQLRTKEHALDYLINLEKAVEIKLDMSSEVASASGWKIVVYDIDSSEFVSFTCRATECREGKSFFFTPNTSGKYKLSVESGSEFSTPTGSYKLQFTTTDSLSKEIEPNDKTPQKVAFGDSLVGSISEASDMDHYSIELSKPGRLSVQLTGSE